MKYSSDSVRRSEEKKQQQQREKSRLQIVQELSVYERGVFFLFFSVHLWKIFFKRCHPMAQQPHDFTYFYKSSENL